MPASAASTNAEKIRGAVSYLTATGRPAVVDGPTEVTVVSGESTVSRFDSAGNPLGPHEFYLVSADVPGETTYQVMADADLGSGIQTITDIITYNVTSEQAASFGFSFGVPEPK